MSNTQKYVLEDIMGSWSLLQITIQERALSWYSGWLETCSNGDFYPMNKYQYHDKGARKSLSLPEIFGMKWRTKNEPRLAAWWRMVG